MTISEMKQRMLNWTDFYGGDIPQTDTIKNAKSKHDLEEVLNAHARLLENTLTDALGHLDDFKKELGLY